MLWRVSHVWKLAAGVHRHRRRSGSLWLVLFRRLYHSPRIIRGCPPRNVTYILAERADARGVRHDADSAATALSHAARLAADVGHHHQQGAAPIQCGFSSPTGSRSISSPRVHRLEDSLLAFWIPFLAADVGNFAGGGLSSWLISRGWSVGAARKLVVVICGLGMTLLIPTVFTSSFFWLIALLRRHRHWRTRRSRRWC